MPGTSARDKCFKEATDAYNDTLPDGKKIKIEHQKPWAIGDNGKWSPLGPLESIWSYIKNLGSPPYRVPDWTLEIDGKPVAGDNKFEGDRYSNRPGRSGKPQLQDQNQMNEDQNPGKEEYQDLNLNPAKCKCDDNPKQEEVYAPELAPGLNRIMIPGVNPVFMPFGAPAPAPVPGFAPGLVPAFGIP